MPKPKQSLKITKPKAKPSKVKPKVKAAEPKEKKINKQAPKFSIELFDRICATIATSSIGLEKICKENGVSSTAFYDWVRKDSELLAKYTRAREDQADFMADEIIQIADDKSGDTIETENGVIQNSEFVNRSRLRVEARKWIAAKLKPKKYGDKIDVTTDGKELPAVVINLGSGIKPADDEATT